MSDTIQTPQVPWARSPAQQALAQVADVVRVVAEIEVTVDADGDRFRAARARGEIDDGAIVVQLDLARVAGDVRIPAVPFLSRLGALGERCRLVVGVEGAIHVVRAELRVAAVPLSLVRMSALADQLRALVAVAAALEAALPAPIDDAALERLYQAHAEMLEPVRPLPDDDLVGWAAELVEFLAAGCSIAVDVGADTPLLEDYALAAIARAAGARASTVGRALPPALDVRALIELARRAPGTLAVAATRLSLGTNPYDLAAQAQSALASLDRAVVFTGSLAALQAVFAGGQGGVADPTRPAVRRAPDPDPDALARFAVRAAARSAGGVPVAVVAEVTRELRAVTARRAPSDERRLLGPLARRAIAAWAAGEPRDPERWADQLASLSETLAGLTTRPRTRREVGARWLRTLIDPALLTHLRSELVGQDRALGALAERLRTEALTRPGHQPIRWAALGTPGTGKSEAAALLARRLDVPYIYVDAASLADQHTAAAQLLGSGRGIVGSFQAGRLEQAAKHHVGAIVEVADLDHAPATVRSFLADLFLQILETGEAQSGTGAIFSCATLGFAFTMNLPGGADERVRRNVGFGELDEREITRRAADEVKQMLSGAFVSRVGAPIVFDPLGDAALATIIARTLLSAVRTATERCGAAAGSVTIAPGTAAAILASAPAGARALGARAYVDHARALAAAAVVAAPLTADAALVVTTSPDGTLALRSTP